MNNSIRLTDRDFRILRDCYRDTVLSFMQIRERHFPCLEIMMAYLRVRVLVKNGFLQAHKVGNSIHHDALRKIAVVYLVTKKAIQALASRYYYEGFKETPAQLNSDTLAHDLWLRAY